MTKSDLIERLAASRMNIPAKDVEAAIKEILEQIA
ncbi:MAG TPA: integration host factor subunit beta, partial [Aeromonas salmonicida]|nr:integration host factor subunit beta [Aeromonas salmonicida]